MTDFTRPANFGQIDVGQQFIEVLSSSDQVYQKTTGTQAVRLSDETIVMFETWEPVFISQFAQLALFE